MTVVGHPAAMALLVVRLMFLIVLVGAVQSGLRARRIRARLDEVPRAVVRRG